MDGWKLKRGKNPETSTYKAAAFSAAPVCAQFSG